MLFGIGKTQSDWACTCVLNPPISGYIVNGFYACLQVSYLPIQQLLQFLQESFINPIPTTYPIFLHPTFSPTASILPTI